MITQRGLMIVALSVIMAGCATGPNVMTHTMPSVDFTNYETFGWPEEVGTDRGGYETSFTQYFKQAARREMTALGYRFVEDDPDLLVNFFTRIEDKERVYTRSSPTLATGYYGYRYGMYGTWPVYTTEIDTFEYQLGTANIDVVDAAERRLIWEGRIEGRLTEGSLVNPQQSISDAVANIFAQFPTRAGD
jgi:hypothetical protein